MKFHKSSLNRRQALKNLSGCIAAPLLMPFANRLTAEARGELPRRFLFVVKSSGLTPAELFAVGVIVFELAMSALILIGRWRWLAALALAGFTLVATFIAIRFWEMPVGQGRMMAMNSFFEHLGLIGGFILVALDDLARTKDTR